MIRATTPKHTFIFENDPSIYSRILITYAQGDKIVMEKEKDDLTIEEVTVEVPDNDCSTNDGETTKTEWHAWYRLTQDETKKFQATPGNQVKVQVRVLTVAGEALASDKKTITVQDVLNDEVLI